MKIEPYTAEKRSAWDSFVGESKNGTFMLQRDYIEYHADRFTDYSLMFYQGERLIAVLPASLHDEVLCSHGGLTYGGLVSNRKMTAVLMLEVFACLCDYLVARGIQKLIYKRIPSIYYSYPSDEDLYALFRFNAKLIRRDLSTAILLQSPVRFAELRRRGVKKARKNGLNVHRTDDFGSYVELLNEVLLARHGAKAVHSAAELSLLAQRFPENIKLYAAFHPEGRMLAGVVVYETDLVAHAQYIANSDMGCKLGALDLVMEYLVELYSPNKLYLDFGISNEDSGRVLNEGLIAQKEGFGGRGIVYDFYELGFNAE